MIRNDIKLNFFNEPVSKLIHLLDKLYLHDTDLTTSSDKSVGTCTDCLPAEDEGDFTRKLYRNQTDCNREIFLQNTH